MPSFKYAVLAVGILAACEQTAPIAPQPDLPADDPRQVQLLAAECTIYFAAVTKLEAEGRTVSGNPTRGCPPEAAGVSADINAMVSVPPVTPGYPQTMYDRMIARGIPVDLADEISKSKAFWDLVARRDSLLADF
ncbi:hypothetical protein [Roseobacter sp. CCS2]|uniref:hypothetical protein n=1 Tax=Roseobacter sp. CCS2 TaxID=391593 RepID=UPI0000F3BFC2|nr:hypothetical protein [Roseobacter sp. CCS2]EBA10571.1 hypothetical protein RCCS2_00020 [Roseobacter sp. CCS2]